MREVIDEGDGAKELKNPSGAFAQILGRVRQWMR